MFKDNADTKLFGGDCHPWIIAPILSPSKDIIYANCVDLFYAQWKYSKDLAEVQQVRISLILFKAFDFFSNYNIYLSWMKKIIK